MDQFRYFADSVASPARSVQPVALNDEQELPVLPKALFVGTGGDIVLRCVDDAESSVLRNVTGGSILPIRAIQLYETGTTASDIVALL